VTEAPRDISVGVHALVLGVALLSIANVPLVPVRGAQLSDVVAAIGAALVLAGALRAKLTSLVSVPGAAAAIAYALAACLSFAVAGGSAMRLLGYVWLPAFGLAVAVAAHDEVAARRIRQALLIAALIGAVAGLVGAVLFWLGRPTWLLNIAGDLVPGDYPRIRGTMLRANALAGLVATGLLLLGDVPRKWRAVVATVLALALVFTFSRSWIALAGAAAVWWLALGPGHTRSRDGLAVVVLLGTVATMLATSWLEVRVDPIRPWTTHLGDGVGTRWIHLQDALETIRNHPFGVGPGRAPTYNGWDAHFAPVNVAAVIGIPAALAFITLVGIAIVRAVRAARAGDAALRGVAAALLLFALDALARDVEDQRTLWVLVGLALAARPRRS
jgi:hypothetical protein